MLSTNPITRRSIRLWLMLWILGSMLGALLVYLPDDNRRIFSLSDMHGPAAVDMIGIVILLAAWLPILMLLWRARAIIRGLWAVTAVILGGAGLLLLGLSLLGYSGGDWRVGAGLLIAAHLLAVAAIDAPPAIH